MAGKLLYDLTGQKFGRWTVIERTESLNNRDTTWLCQCECGTIKAVLGKNLRNGRSKSCGCYKKEADSKRMAESNKERSLDLTGHKYGLLTPIRPTDKRCSSSIVWECLCDCGNTTFVSVDNLRGRRPVRSCGCLGRSAGEHNIFEVLEKNHVHFSAEYHPQDGYGRYDFAILDDNNNVIRLIEFDGEQHFGTREGWGAPVEEIQRLDKIKNEYAFSHNVPIVRIPYWERYNITLEMLLNDKYLVKEEDE